MLFKRKIYSKFLAWKSESNGRKALLVEQAEVVLAVHDFGHQLVDPFASLFFTAVFEEKEECVGRVAGAEFVLTHVVQQDAVDEAQKLGKELVA